jgi:dephospho-CoA kinase
MLKVGLTGGMACGKSFVAAALGELGCHILEADDVAHEVISPGGEAYDAVLTAFGPGILDDQKRIDRAFLAAKVFGDPVQLDRLNAIVHPAVRARALREFAAIGASDPHGIVIYVAAILIESGAYREVDKIIVVSCAREQQIERAMHRPGASQTSVLARLDRQMSLEKKKEFADYVIDTSGERESTLRQTKEICQQLKSEALRRSS